MNFKTYLEKRKGLIDRALDRCLPEEMEAPRAVHKAMRYSVFSGGKRLRPIIALESCLICGGRLREALIAASAMELVHTYSLIHDDLPSMDDDDYRRGKPTCHIIFGEANAILAGDALLTLAFNILARGLSPAKGVKVIMELSVAIGTRGMVGGQAMDLEASAKKTGGKNKKEAKGRRNPTCPPKLEERRRINRLKTSMLFETSARSGAIVAGAARQEIRAMSDYGGRLGMLFQITDDIMDGEYASDIKGGARPDHDMEILGRGSKSSLNIFGKKAHRLIEIVDHILERTR